MNNLGEMIIEACMKLSEIYLGHSVSNSLHKSFDWYEFGLSVKERHDTFKK